MYCGLTDPEILRRTVDSGFVRDDVHAQLHGSFLHNAFYGSAPPPKRFRLQNRYPFRVCFSTVADGLHDDAVRNGNVGIYLTQTPTGNDPHRRSALSLEYPPVGLSETVLPILFVITKTYFKSCSEVEKTLERNSVSIICE